MIADAYKLFKLRNDGTIGPLFINHKQVIPMDEWLKAEDHPTKGYAHRPGWHVCLDIVAPHLTMKGRIWCAVEVADYVELKRPESQGTTWILANEMRVLAMLNAKHENPFD
jgi:hypothetical protein